VQYLNIHRRIGVGYTYRYIAVRIQRQAHGGFQPIKRTRTILPIGCDFERLKILVRNGDGLSARKRDSISRVLAARQPIDHDVAAVDGTETSVPADAVGVQACPLPASRALSNARRVVTQLTVFLLNMIAAVRNVADHCTFVGGTRITVIARQCRCSRTDAVLAFSVAVARIVVARGAVGHQRLDAGALQFIAFLNRTGIAGVSCTGRRTGPGVHAESGAVAHSRHAAETELGVGACFPFVLGYIGTFIVLLVAFSSQTHIRIRARNSSGNAVAAVATLNSIAEETIAARLAIWLRSKIAAVAGRAEIIRAGIVIIAIRCFVAAATHAVTTDIDEKVAVSRRAVWIQLTTLAVMVLLLANSLIAEVAVCTQIVVVGAIGVTRILVAAPEPIAVGVIRAAETLVATNAGALVTIVGEAHGVFWTKCLAVDDIRLAQIALAMVVAELLAIVILLTHGETRVRLIVAGQTEFGALAIIVAAIPFVTTDPRYLIAIAGYAIRVVVTLSVSGENIGDALLSIAVIALLAVRVIITGGFTNHRQLISDTRDLCSSISTLTCGKGRALAQTVTPLLPIAGVRFIEIHGSACQGIVDALIVSGTWSRIAYQFFCTIRRRRTTQSFTATDIVPAVRWFTLGVGFTRFTISSHRGPAVPLLAVESIITQIIVVDTPDRAGFDAVVAAPDQAFHAIAVITVDTAPAFFAADRAFRIAITRKAIGVFVAPLGAVQEVFLAQAAVAMNIFQRWARAVIIFVQTVTAGRQALPAGEIAGIPAAIIVSVAAGSRCATDVSWRVAHTRRAVRVVQASVLAVLQLCNALVLRAPVSLHAVRRFSTRGKAILLDGRSGAAECPCSSICLIGAWGDWFALALPIASIVSVTGRGIRQIDCPAWHIEVLAHEIPITKHRTALFLLTSAAVARCSAADALVAAEAVAAVGWTAFAVLIAGMAVRPLGYCDIASFVAVGFGLGVAILLAVIGLSFGFRTIRDFRTVWIASGYRGSIAVHRRLIRGELFRRILLERDALTCLAYLVFTAIRGALTLIVICTSNTQEAKQRHPQRLKTEPPHASRTYPDSVELFTEKQSFLRATEYDNWLICHLWHQFDTNQIQNACNLKAKFDPYVNHIKTCSWYCGGPEYERDSLYTQLFSKWKPDFPDHSTEAAITAPR
jgi:hypothetical protein